MANNAWDASGDSPLVLKTVRMPLGLPSHFQHIPHGYHGITTIIMMVLIMGRMTIVIIISSEDKKMTSE